LFSSYILKSVSTIDGNQRKGISPLSLTLPLVSDFPLFTCIAANYQLGATEDEFFPDFIERVEDKAASSHFGGDDIEPVL